MLSMVIKNVQVNQPFRVHIFKKKWYVKGNRVIIVIELGMKLPNVISLTNYQYLQDGLLFEVKIYAFRVSGNTS